MSKDLAYVRETLMFNFEAPGNGSKSNGESFSEEACIAVTQNHITL
jgi:hypothetical protein